MTELNRREFLGTTALGASLSALAPALFAVDDPPASKPDPVRIAVMGVNGRGKSLMSTFCSFPHVKLAYICDPDQAVIPSAMKIAEQKGQDSVKVVSDFRTALDDKDVDVLICAAPDHWHALAVVWGCEAGKDVYSEKPACHNIREGQEMVATARKHKRVVQIGTQRRSGTDYQALVQALQKDKKIGDIKMVRTWITSARPNIGHVAVSQPPASLDFSLWAGPGPDNVYKTNLVHYHWHWRWDFGTGECGNNGIHGLDVARWGMGVEEPKIITCGGGKYAFDDDQETPDTQLATFDFGNGIITWEHRTWARRTIDGQTFGVEFYGTDGVAITGEGGWKIIDGDKVVESHPSAELEKAHIGNFLDCIVSREKPNADVEIGVRSTQLCHLANIAYRTRSTLKWDAEKGTIVDNPAAQALMGRTYRKGFELHRT
ncbi:MAG TPA: Gfo/Idh/MocA family oxidoreductase [Planctomycetaceae bacterium]|nr:Gfo/Idh/MocA family oxidoreductase [Planctomycetaceae bacterium]